MFSLLLLVASSIAAAAELTPVAPGPGDTFATGSPCTIQWDADTSGKWTNMSIYLMSGSNDNMTRVTTVTSGVDGTDGTLSPYQWTCPDVEPYSAIYFYQFTNGDDSEDSKWTTRFTITSPSGESERPQHKTQPDGDAVPWGEGHLATTDGNSTQDSDSASATSLRSANKAVDTQESADSPSTSIESTSNAHQHHKTTLSTAPSDTASPSHSTLTTPRTSSTHSAPRSSDHSTSTGINNLADASIPTAGLPAEKMHSTRTHTHSSSYPSGSAAPSSAMGPGIPEAGGMQLASSGRVRRDEMWLKTTSLCPLLLAMLL
ncbi:hypothetical protein L226DRAFT_556872 [Lentinus tigrinus ALCF2SS1-7]|uniref:Yeast cell wall synthesis Kre9/Knh1-like N-terminal domain-containing protein n=1 Tax=Lentinus tigrinus ALCF2SS1-6 TaxID=1328759 RepID=A0A5C2SVS8_9APHY|nr:hypothetical protein L227DRAFT_590046 [Lentinus tigrinus ALCF2SS1-6]RPD81118.1 hypothetical protein L226DRAFT_556872 [Lentinus tigrinus ALCF2SS1-7]